MRQPEHSPNDRTSYEVEVAPDRDFSGYTKANLGCGDDYRDGDEWLNVDLRSNGPGMAGGEVAPDMEYNLNRLPWPFPDNCFERVEIHNVLEHLDDQFKTLAELHRVTKPVGEIIVSGPHWNCASTWIDPTHTRPFDPRTFNHYLVDDKFQVIDLELVKVRWARVIPDRAALWIADMAGHGVIEFTVTVSVKK